MPKSILTENTIIGEAAVSAERYRSFFRKAIEGFSPEIHCGEFKHWLSLNNGKTIREAIASYRLSQKNMPIKDFSSMGI